MGIATIETPETKDYHLSIWVTKAELNRVRSFCERASVGDGHRKLSISELFRQAVNDFTGEQIF